MSKIIGIDLGTTNQQLQFLEGTGKQNHRKPRRKPHNSISSVIQNGEIIVAMLQNVKQ